MSKIVLELHGDFPNDSEGKAQVLEGLVKALAEVHYDGSCFPFSEMDVRVVARAQDGDKELSLARYLSSDLSLVGFWKRKKDGLPKSFGASDV